LQQPVRETTTLRGHPNTKFFAVLNVDTTEDLGVDFLNTQQIKIQIKGLAGYAQLTLC
jgi:hypothetical protein